MQARQARRRAQAQASRALVPQWSRVASRQAAGCAREGAPAPGQHHVRASGAGCQRQEGQRRKRYAGVGLATLAARPRHTSKRSQNIQPAHAAQAQTYTADSTDGCAQVRKCGAS